MNWHKHAKSYLDRLAQAEYKAQKAQHLKARRSVKTFRYGPTDYHRDLVDYLTNDNEEAFKALKMLQGYASALKV